MVGYLRLRVLHHDTGYVDVTVPINNCDSGGQVSVSSQFQFEMACLTSMTTPESPLVALHQRYN